MPQSTINALTLLRLVTAYHDSWQRYFPGLFKRSHWLIAAHLCSKGRVHGAPFADLCEQVFWQDDATIKKRVTELIQHELCSIEPSDTAVTKHTMAISSAKLREQFDRHLLDFMRHFVAIVQNPPVTKVPDEPLDDSQRQLILRALEYYRSNWKNAVDRALDAHSLAGSRLVVAKRKLLSTRHFTLLHSVVAHHYESATNSDGSAETSANELASVLWTRIKQPHNTTFLHLNELVRWGFLVRADGREFLVRLAPSVAHFFDAALGQTEDELKPIAERLFASFSGGAIGLAASGEQTSKIVVLRRQKS